jgi:hypothetical protein
MFSMGETMQPMRSTATETAVPRTANVEDLLAAFFDADVRRAYSESLGRGPCGRPD